MSLKGRSRFFDGLQTINENGKFKKISGSRPFSNTKQ